jgi:hypothetical protein
MRSHQIIAVRLSLRPLIILSQATEILGGGGRVLGRPALVQSRVAGYTRPGTVFAHFCMALRRYHLIFTVPQYHPSKPTQILIPILNPVYPCVITPTTAPPSPTLSLPFPLTCDHHPHQSAPAKFGAPALKKALLERSIFFFQIQL